MHCLTLYIFNSCLWISVNFINNFTWDVTPLFKYFQLNSCEMDYINKSRKIAFLGWNQKIKKCHHDKLHCNVYFYG